MELLKNNREINVYWAGDSTVQYNDITTYPQTGIGQVMGLYFKENVVVKNFAKNGRSTKSFIDEGRMIPIYDGISEGDFLFIQFGHNDEKIHDETRYTAPKGEFTDNLKKFINVANNKGAHPVLITPLERRDFGEDGVLNQGEHGEYVAAMIAAGEKFNVPVIDLNKKSRDKLNGAGPEKTTEWYMHLPEGVYASCPEGKIDNTHLKYQGAVIYAGCIAEGLRELGGIYNDLLVAQN